MPTLRAATPADLPAIAAIHAHAVRHTPAVFRDEPLPQAEWAAWIRSDHPTRVAEVAGAVAGYIAARPYAPGYSGYDGMAWVSVYVHHGARGQGLGRALMADLIAACRARGLRELVSRIARPNDASEGLHRAFGFEPVGVYKRAGVKFGRQFDVALYQLGLGEVEPG
ncbi:MAG: N-acetyltransferase [Myxococcales bacterium]|nr:N-acetyltransferase [Myxococcales bacterium]MCB9522778.1 N-acetyltransferase [Myxococcales bacterium]